jgi:L-iditol 2-dehydrogenase
MTDAAATGPGATGAPTAVPATMTAARLHGRGDLRIVEEPVPTPGAGESLVRVTAVGICGSDLHWYRAGSIGDSALRRPLAIGHEFAGVVADGPLRGVRVAVDPAIPCGACEVCATGAGNLCPAVHFAGHGEDDGALREYVAWPTRLLYPLPDSLSDVDGAMLEPLGVALYGLDLARPRLGGSVAVVGCGPIGLFVVQLARLAGADLVIAVDPLPHRRKAALRFGADHAFSGEGADRPDWGELAGIGVDVAYEVAGTDAAVDTALTAARPGGRVVLIGIPEDDRTAFRASIARRKGLRIQLARRMHDVYPRVIRLLASRRVDAASVVTASYPMARAAEAFTAAAARSGLKTVITPAAGE